MSLAHRLASAAAPSDASLPTDVAAWGLGMSKLVAASYQMPLKAWIWDVARMLVEVGCSIIWPDLSSSDDFLDPDVGALPLHLAPTPLGRSPELAGQHLARVVAALSELLAWWEGHRINVNNSSTLPAALTWARAMLAWFQWRLWVSGATPEPPGDARLSQGVRGWSRGAPCPPGPRAVSRGLLLARAMASSALDEERSELLTASLTSTVALGMMMAGAGLPLVDKLETGESDPGRVQHGPDGLGSLLLPLSLPGQVGDDRSPSQAPIEEPERVEMVQLGSQRALELGSAHLGQVLSRVKVGGAQVDLGAPSASHVGYSSSLWRAVALYQAMTRQLSAAAL